MTTFPLSTLAAQITATGIFAPPYSDILTSLQASYMSIFGSDVVLTADSQDGQFLAILANSINDANNTAIATYNAFSPTSAQGTGLSSVVKLNGLKREVPTFSVVTLTIVGQAAAVITNGFVGDNQNLNTQWALTSPIVIPGSGTINVTATCTTPGAINAAPGTLNQIVNPTRGWQSSTNAVAAVPGSPVETDAALRKRQSISTALPAQTPMESIVAQVADVPGVNRFRGYENSTGITDANGVPGHSISLVVEGGSPTAITNAIFLKKNPGTGTYGTTTEVVIDSEGFPDTIHFFVAAEVTISVVVNVTMLPNWSASTIPLIQASEVAAILALEIGQYSRLANLIAAAILPNALAQTYFVTSVTQSRVSPPTNTTVTGGPYAAGSTVVGFASVKDVYGGAIVAIQLDDASFFDATISNIVGTSVTFSPGVPGGRSILTSAVVQLDSDVQIIFNEVATTITADVTVNVT